MERIGLSLKDVFIYKSFFHNFHDLHDLSCGPLGRHNQLHPKRARHPRQCPDRVWSCGRYETRPVAQPSKRVRFLIRQGVGRQGQLGRLFVVRLHAHTQHRPNGQRQARADRRSGGERRRDEPIGARKRVETGQTVAPLSRDDRPASRATCACTRCATFDCDVATTCLRLPPSSTTSATAWKKTERRVRSWRATCTGWRCGHCVDYGPVLPLARPQTRWKDMIEGW